MHNIFNPPFSRKIVQKPPSINMLIIISKTCGILSMFIVKCTCKIMRKADKADVLFKEMTTCWPSATPEDAVNLSGSALISTIFVGIKFKITHPLKVLPTPLPNRY